MEKKNHYINIHQDKDLVEIDAHYFRSFTATADDDVVELLNFLQAYIAVQEDQVPDVSISVQCDQDVIVKNLSLSKADIHACTNEILQGNVDIVALLVLSSLNSTKRKFKMNEESQVMNILNSRIEKMENLQSTILNEHGEEQIEHYEGMEIS